MFWSSGSTGIEVHAHGSQTVQVPTKPSSSSLQAFWQPADVAAKLLIHISPSMFPCDKVPVGECHLLIFATMSLLLAVSHPFTLE